MQPINSEINSTFHFNSTELGIVNCWSHKVVQRALLISSKANTLAARIFIFVHSSCASITCYRCSTFCTHNSSSSKHFLQLLHQWCRICFTLLFFALSPYKWWMTGKIARLYCTRETTEPWKTLTLQYKWELYWCMMCYTQAFLYGPYFVNKATMNYFYSAAFQVPQSCVILIVICLGKQKGSVYLPCSHKCF